MLLRKSDFDRSFLFSFSVSSIDSKGPGSSRPVKICVDDSTDFNVKTKMPGVIQYKKSKMIL